MAARPWAVPQEVRDYTDHEEVAGREEGKLKADITRAERKVISITNNHFEDKDYPELPEPVKLAVLLIADAYAKNAAERAKKQIKSETFDDYSYTAGTAEIDINSLDLDVLLDDYVIAPACGNMVMRLRKL